MTTDLLVFGPHPDDLEIGLGATIARHVASGLTVGLCDLTRGEMGSNGTVEERRAEAEAARQTLGAAWRENLGWPDRAIGRNPDDLGAAIDLIRRARPRAIAVPYWVDRHPDHEAASHVLTDVIFNAGLRRYPAKGDAWKPAWVCYYFINNAVTPSFVVDVSAYYETKRKALACYASQFHPSAPDAVATPLTSEWFPRRIESRDAQFGALSGVAFAEGFIVKEPVVRSSLLKDWDSRR